MDLEQIGLIGGAVSTLGVVASAILGLRGWWKRSILPRLTSLDEIALLITGRPAIVAPERPDVILAPALPGALERLTSVDDSLAAVRTELTTMDGRLDTVEQSVCTVQCAVNEVNSQLVTNGGSSLRDAVNRVEVLVEGVVQDRLGEAS